MSEDSVKENTTGYDASIVTPCDASYEQARQGWNRAIQQYPCQIVYCQSAEDVAAAVQWAGKQGIPLRVRSGRHNYEGYSNGNGAMVIDVSQMHNLQIDEAAGTLRVGGGVTNRQLYAYVSAQGYPFPGGTCPTVGVSGYALGGGWGLSCRLFGLGCDNLRELQLINARGELLTANSSENADLFWACRGAGGGNFGVVVSLLFALPPKVEYVTVIELDYLHTTIQRQADFLRAWCSWLEQADNRMTLVGRIYRSERDGTAMLLRGIFYGSPEEAAQMVEVFLALEPTGQAFSYVPFLEATEILGGGYPPSEKFAAVSRFSSGESIARNASKLVQLLEDSSAGAVFEGLSLYALGGKVAEAANDDTAFFYRRADSILWLQSVWEEDSFAEENRCWVANRVPALSAVTIGSYVNFPYDCLPCSLGEYYGPHTNRLCAVKRKYDPCNVFSFPQGIFPSCTNVCPCKRAESPAVDMALQGEEKDTLGYRGFRYV